MAGRVRAARELAQARARSRAARLCLGGLAKLLAAKLLVAKLLAAKLLAAKLLAPKLLASSTGACRPAL